MILNSPTISGSLTVTGNIIASGSITLSGSVASASYAATASFVALAQSASNAVSAETASFANAFTVASTLTAQTLVVQTITSSVDFVTGSTRFGSILGNTHVFSGSVTMNPNGLFVSSSGLVGIGNVVPAYTLDVSGTIRTSATQPSSIINYTDATSYANLIFTESGTNKGVIQYIGSTFATTARRNNLEIVNGANADMTFWTNNTTRMTITSAGNVGIGTTIPAEILDAEGNLALRNSETYSISLTRSIIYRSNTASYGMQPIANINFLTTGDTASAISFTTRNGAVDYNERMRITSGGNIFIGYVNAGVTDTRMYISGQGTTSSTFAMVIKQSNNSTNLFIVRDDGLIQTGTASGSPYNNTSGAAANVVVNSSGTLERSTSSLKYKTDVKDYDKGLSEVLKMRPVYYKSINEREKDLQFAGLIAEEIHDLGLTEFVQYADDGTPDALAYQNMVALLTKAIQELKTENDALQSRIETLESK